jgi:osmoprotectant transport system permease protein
MERIEKGAGPMKLMLFFLTTLVSTTYVSASPIVIGSKAFTEGRILSEIAAQDLESHGAHIQRRFNMGGTGILFGALTHNKIQLYPEYTGTISEAILKNIKFNNIEAIRRALKPLGLTVSNSLGFNDTYAIAVRRDYALAHHLHTMSDLQKLNPRIVFSNEFKVRRDGYPTLQSSYGYDFKNITTMEHSLAYEAIAKNKADVTDVYSTDGKIKKLNLVVLEDDRRVFPTYQAVWLARIDFVTQNAAYWRSLSRFEGRLHENNLMDLNEQVDIQGRDVSTVVGAFLKSPPSEQQASMFKSLVLRTQEHLTLVLIPLFFGIVVGLPLAIAAANATWLGQIILVGSSFLETTPTLALLCLLIPLVGIGTQGAMVALFIYSLMPIILNAYTGLTSLDQRNVEVAKVLGLTRWQRLWRIELPLASPHILTGVKTSAITGVGTATLAALIGAGGYGVMITTGLTMNDTRTMLQGAIPAVMMAIMIHFVFEILNFAMIPKGLRLLHRPQTKTYDL